MHSTGFRTSDPRILMEIFNILVYIYIYIYICQDGGAVGFADFTKLSFYLSSLAQPFDQMGGIPEYVFVTQASAKPTQGVFTKKQPKKEQVR